MTLDIDETLLVARDDRRRCKLVQAPARALERGEVRLRVERFALTSNNVTYAALSRVMPYFEFFPFSAEPGWGVLPVWGIARVEATERQDVQTGARFFGFFPAARSVILTPADVRGGGFRVERAGIEPEYAVYHHYQRTEVDPLHLPAQEDAAVVFRPLFLTGLALADYLSCGPRAKADAIIVSSASSKTSYGLATAFRQHPHGRRVVGLTSAANVGFVESLATYDQVVPYDALDTLPEVLSAIHVDVAGSGSVRESLRWRLGAHLSLTVSVGIAHGDPGGYSRSAAGPGTEVFFAPGWMMRRRMELGDAYLQATLRGWRRQMDGVERHFELQRRRGGEAARETYLDLVDHGHELARAAYVAAL